MLIKEQERKEARRLHLTTEEVIWGKENGMATDEELLWAISER